MKRSSHHARDGVKHPQPPSLSLPHSFVTDGGNDTAMQLVFPNSCRAPCCASKSVETAGLGWTGLDWADLARPARKLRSRAVTTVRREQAQPSFRCSIKSSIHLFQLCDLWLAVFTVGTCSASADLCRWQTEREDKGCELLSISMSACNFAGLGMVRLAKP